MSGLIASLLLRLLFQVLETACGNVLTRVARLLTTFLLVASALIVTLVPHACVHDTAFTTLRCPYGLACISSTSAFGRNLIVIGGVFLLENTGTLVLDSLRLSLLVILLLRPFLIVVLALVLVVLGGCNLVALLLDPVRLLALVAWSLNFSLATHTTQFLVALDEVV